MTGDLLLKERSSLRTLISRVLSCARRRRICNEFRVNSILRNVNTKAVAEKEAFKAEQEARAALQGELIKSEQREMKLVREVVLQQDKYRDLWLETKQISAQTERQIAELKTNITDQLSQIGQLQFQLESTRGELQSSKHGWEHKLLRRERASELIREQLRAQLETNTPKNTNWNRSFYGGSKRAN